MATDAPPFEFLWLVVESAYGTPKTSPVAGTDSIYIRLAGANRFTVRPAVTRRKIVFGGGFAAPGYAVSDQAAVTGGLDVELCYTQFALLMGWGCNRINSGQTTPWTTTEPIADMASVSAYHGIARDDGTIKRRHYAGVKVHGGKIGTGASAGLTMLHLDLQGKKWDGNTYDASADPDATAFPAPADTAFPTDPMLFVETTVNVGGSPLAYANGLDISWSNVMDARFFAGSHFVKFDRLRGRNAAANVPLLYTASPDWRTEYEALTSQAFNAVWANGTHTATVTMEANVLLDAVGDDLTPGKVFDQSLTFESQYDTSAHEVITTSFS